MPSDTYNHEGVLTQLSIVIGIMLTQAFGLCYAYPLASCPLHLLCSISCPDRSQPIRHGDSRLVGPERTQ